MTSILCTMMINIFDSNTYPECWSKTCIVPILKRVNYKTQRVIEGLLNLVVKHIVHKCYEYQIDRMGQEIIHMS